MASSVDFPQPEGPTRTTNSPVCDLEVDALQHLHRAETLAEFLTVSDAIVLPAALYLTAPCVRPRTK